MHFVLKKYSLLTLWLMCHLSTNWHTAVDSLSFLSFFLSSFYSFCGNGKFLLLLTVLRNLENKQGVLRVMLHGMIRYDDF